MRRWLSDSLKDLSKSANNVEDFVEQNNNLNRISEEFPEIRDKIDLYG